MKTTVTAERVVAEVDNGNNPDGSKAMERWDMRPDQAERHIATFADPDRPEEKRIRPGDASAIRDAARDRQRELERRGE